jgi:SAM-dependent methyltransferase
LRRDLDQRLIVPELLDSLPADDTRAIKSRRDLIWINALMFQSRTMASLLRRHVQRVPTRILELGSGDGAFMLSVARRMGRAWSNVDLVMIDKADLVTSARRSEFGALGWRVETVVDDIFSWTSRSGVGPFDLVCANLVLHHFNDAALGELFGSMAHLTSCFIATEPRRSPVALAACSLLRVIGANDVTMHDAAASVRAGFAGGELRNLWPTAFDIGFDERRVGPFAHVFAAERIR